MKLFYLLAFTSVALCACVTVPSKVISTGLDTYTLNMTGVGFATQGNTNMKALSEASAYCENLHKKMLVKNNAESGVYGWSPRQSTLTFQCLNASDPAYVTQGAAK